MGMISLERRWSLVRYARSRPRLFQNSGGRRRGHWTPRKRRSHAHGRQLSPANSLRFRVSAPSKISGQSFETASARNGHSNSRTDEPDHVACCLDSLASVVNDSLHLTYHDKRGVVLWRHPTAALYLHCQHF
jgi:hypothetical protein